MRRMRHSLSLLLLSAGMAWAALAGAPPEELERNRWLLEHLRHDRVHHARLLRDARALHALPPGVQTRLQVLDGEIQARTSAVQVRLLHAAERYAQWLHALPAADRARIDAEPSKDKRLAIIKEIRQRQWVEQLPPSLHTRIEKAFDPKAAIAQLRSEERRGKADWQMALRQWDVALPDRLDKLPAVTRAFVTNDLLPRLPEDDRKRLRSAEGHWPQYPRTLVDVVDSDRIAFRLLMPLKGPSRWDDLPKDFHKKLRQVKAPELAKKRLHRLEGHWPEFAFVLAETARRNNIPMPRQLGPCFSRDFPKPIRDFIHEKLTSFNTGVLDREERERLRGAEGYWPLYPRTLLELARKHNLAIPGVRLPGPAGYWDNYRDRPRPNADEPTMVSDLVLRVFAQFELTDAERAETGLALSDPMTRARVQDAYRKRYPREWQALVDADRQKLSGKPAR